MDVKKLRKQSGLLQADWWARFGVTQSGGCRYENGRRIPKPLALLLTIGLGTKAQSNRTVDALRK